MLVLQQIQLKFNADRSQKVVVKRTHIYVLHVCYLTGFLFRKYRVRILADGTDGRIDICPPIWHGFSSQKSKACISQEHLSNHMGKGF